MTPPDDNMRGYIGGPVGEIRTTATKQAERTERTFEQIDQRRAVTAEAPRLLELVEVGPFPIYFGNVNVAMGLRGHHHTAEIRLVYQTLGQHGYPSFKVTNDAIRTKLQELTKRTFRDATNEDVARRLWAHLYGWVDESWLQWGGVYVLHALHLDVQGVQDDIGHDPSVTRYTIERISQEDQ